MLADLGFLNITDRGGNILRPGDVVKFGPYIAIVGQQKFLPEVVREIPRVEQIKTSAANLAQQIKATKLVKRVAATLNLNLKQSVRNPQNYNKPKLELVMITGRSQNQSAWVTQKEILENIAVTKIPNFRKDEECQPYMLAIRQRRVFEIARSKMLNPLNKRSESSAQRYLVKTLTMLNQSAQRQLKYAA